MTTHYYGQPPEVEEVVVAWLSELGTASVERPAGDVLPYRMVTRIGGSDDKITDRCLVSVHTFASTRTAANSAARVTHNRMLILLPDTQISLPSGGSATVDRIETAQGPIWQDWGVDTIQRYVARYEIDLRFVKAPGS